MSNIWTIVLILWNFGYRWEKYDAKGWTEKGAHKYGRLNEQSWWEKWGENYDGRGSVLKWFSLLIFSNQHDLIIHRVLLITIIFKSIVL